MKQETLKIITADDGKVFKRISDGEILGEKLTFDIRYDTELNYIEVDAPIENDNP